MDPLSVVASVIACLQAANAVVSVCLDYRAALKQAPWGLAQTLEEVRDLRNVLEAVSEVADRVANQDGKADPADKTQWASLRLLCSDHGPLQNCATELARLEKRLCPPKWAENLGPRRKALVQALGWRIKDSDVKESLQTIGRCKATITLALTADEAVLLANIQALSLSMQANLSSLTEDMSALVQDQHTEKLDKRHKAMLKWLAPTHADLNDRVNLATTQASHSDWILDCEEFLRWRTDSKQDPLLWLSGIPGAGKTTLLAKVVHHFQQKLSESGNERIAYYFCDFRTAESQEARNVIGSLVAQLCTKMGWFPPELESSFERSINSVGKEVAPEILVLTDALTLLAQQSNIVLLVDALDECRNPSEILDSFNKLKQNVGIKIFVTSRDEAHIGKSLANAIRIRLEDQAEEMSDDICDYIQTRLSTEPKLQWLSASFRTDVQLSLLAKSGGMFRWVQCQIDQILPLRTIRAIRKALVDLPDGLDDTYERILLGVPHHHIDVVQKILQWLSFTKSPLTLAMLHDAIAIDPELDFLDEESQLSSPQDIFELCSSLITATSGGTVQLAHASVREYLLSAKIKNSSAAEFALAPHDSMVAITRSCLTYLSFKEFAKGPAASYSEFELRPSRYPLLNHAAVAWPNQFLAAGEPQELNDEVMHFLTADHNKFMSWVQVLNSLPFLGRDPASAWQNYPRLATPLYYAASFGLLEVVRKLVAAGEDLNASASRYGGTALHGAVVRHHMPVIKLLLEAGADVNKQDSNSITPLQTAVFHDEAEIISLLLDYGAVQGDLPSSWFDSTTVERLETAGANSKRQEIQAVLPGNENIQSYLEEPKEMKSFDIFA